MNNKFKKTYPHYYKKIPKGVTHIDVYRVLELWNVSSPAIQHAIKKLLACGDRGYKDTTADVSEAVVALTRWIEMREEEYSEIEEPNDMSCQIEEPNDMSYRLGWMNTNNK